VILQLAPRHDDCLRVSRRSEEAAHTDMIDANDARERTHRRGKHIKFTIFTGLMARASSMLVTIISVPLALSYLGNERFGLWMTATSVVSMLAFADFGIGNGLLSAVAEASGRDDLEAIRRYISSGFAILIAIAVCMLLLFFSTAYPLVDWAHVFNVHTSTPGRRRGRQLPRS
jgi:Polysaccharide biosynthesis protein